MSIELPTATQSSHVDCPVSQQPYCYSRDVSQLLCSLKEWFVVPEIRGQTPQSCASGPISEEQQTSHMA